MAIYLPTSIHLSNLTWSNAIESNRIESTVISSNLMQYHAISTQFEPEKIRRSQYNGRTEGLKLWCLGVTLHTPLVDLAVRRIIQGQKEKDLRVATGHLPPRFCGTMRDISTGFCLNRGFWCFVHLSFLILQSTKNHLQKSPKIINAGGKLQKRQTHGIYVHKTRSSRSKGQDVKTRNFKRDKLILPFRRKYGSDLDQNMALRLSLDMGHEGHEGHKRCGMMWNDVDEGWLNASRQSKRM